MVGKNTDETAFYRISADAALKRLGANKDGLSNDEADKRLVVNGPNGLVTLHRESGLRKYLRQYKDLMILLLLGSAIISVYLKDIRTGIVLGVLILFNTLIGFRQEYRADRLMESLEKLVHPETKVMRAGLLISIPTASIVSGDIIYIEEGDSIPADIRMFSESELATNDFALTGESNPSRKFTHAISGEVQLADRHNLCYMGTTVATGHGYGVVVGTGMQTELGRIASLSQSTVAEVSPLQKEMNHIAKRITQGTIILCVPLFFIAKHANVGGDPGIRTAFLFAIGIASSLIPQGLPAEINTALAHAANKLASMRALVKKLSAVETLGSTSIICTDKTGTLTKNEMTVEQLLVGTVPAWISGSGYENNGVLIDQKGRPLPESFAKDSELFFVTSVFASNASVNPANDLHPSWYVIGDPTEGALITMSAKAGYDSKVLNEAYPEIKEHSFDSARKRMSSTRLYNNKPMVFVKGAPENILAVCTHYWQDGKILTLTAHDREKILARNDMLASAAMRNLALAYKALPASISPKTLSIDEAESELVFLGMASMIDPPREDIPEAMKAARQAHIPIIIITGDNALTASAIAIKAGLAQSVEDLTTVLGQDLETMPDKDIAALLQKGNIVFSRVAPEDKLRIVELAKSLGLVVAVTGDGINDAPALKRADIGVAMGRTGTDVAKQSAGIILLDDSFHTLVGAIQEGRIIYQNIKKGALSCFTGNTAELFTNLFSLAAAVAYGLPLAIGIMQILAIDLIAELFPIAALGSDGAENDLMLEYPRDPRDHILNRSSIIDLMIAGLIIGSLAFTNFLLVFNRAGADPTSLLKDAPVYLRATTVTYLTIVLCQLGNILQRRSPKGLFTRFQFTNPRLWIALSFSMFCVLNISYNPWIAPYFKSGPLNAVDWLYASGAMVVFLAIREFQIRTRRTVANSTNR